MWLCDDAPLFPQLATWKRGPFDVLFNQATPLVNSRVPRNSAAGVPRQRLVLVDEFIDTERDNHMQVEYSPDKQLKLFTRWANVDVYCVSPDIRLTELLTLPPTGIINAAHVNGVRVWGTLHFNVRACFVEQPLGY